jgi:rubrerythrin
MLQLGNSLFQNFTLKNKKKWQCRVCGILFVALTTENKGYEAGRF